MRIISLSPSFTEILQALSAESHLIGISDHCPEIPGPLRIGSPKALKISEILATGPDIVLADQNENRPEEMRELQKKLRVMIFDVRSLDAVHDAVHGIGRLIAKNNEAQHLIENIQSEIEKNRKMAAQRPPVPTVILLWDQPYLTVNFDTYASRLVEISGGKNVFHQDPIREFPVDLEDMIEKNPECLILPNDPFPFAKKHTAKFRKYRVFSKISISLIDGKLFSRFGPRTIEALQKLRGIFFSLRKTEAGHEA